jgi:hypothetical protein
MTETEEDFYLHSKPVIEKELYKLGGITDNDKEAYAKKFTTTTTTGESKRETFRYKIATYCGNLYDPLGSYSKREHVIKSDFRFLDVSESTFNNYVKYLVSKDNNNFIAACRGFIND